jgi:hypothetical protein
VCAGAAVLSFALAACTDDNSPARSSAKSLGPDAPEAQRALALFDSFQRDLKTELSAAIASGGTAGAIDRCHTVSPALEERLSREGITVRRISDRPRNPAHAPDEFEARALEYWSGELAAGRPLAPRAEQTDAGVRVMRPILVQGMCLACHGDPEQIEARTLAKIRARYPSDRATGYQEGELRGAFSATIAREMRSPAVDPEY